MPSKTYSQRALTVTLNTDGPEVEVLWSGKSTLRDPSQFLLPILKEALHHTQSQRKRMRLDFREVQYMNSSTFTPVVRVLDEARRTGAKVSIIYSSEQKWQELSFTALEIFTTEDGRITIEGS